MPPDPTGNSPHRWKRNTEKMAMNRKAVDLGNPPTVPGNRPQPTQHARPPIWIATFSSYPLRPIWILGTRTERKTARLSRLRQRDRWELQIRRFVGLLQPGVVAQAFFCNTRQPPNLRQAPKPQPQRQPAASPKVAHSRLVSPAKCLILLRLLFGLAPLTASDRRPLRPFRCPHVRCANLIRIGSTAL
jgi:hypothetical protein